jgi:hypothetical protein
MPFDGIRTLEQIGQAAIRRGRLHEILDDGSLVVRDDEEPRELIHCDFLITGSNPHPELVPGSAVLFAPPETEGRRGCVLGVIGKYASSCESERTNGADQESESLTIRRDNIEIVADSKLVLRCGEGTLTVSDDGTIIIRGTRMLSRSKGINKIKGAAVQIN